MKSIFIYFLKVFLRDKKAFIGSVITPIFFLLLFGTIFGSSDTTSLYKVGVFPEVPKKLEKTLSLLKLNAKIFENETLIKDAIKKGKIDIGIKVEKNSLTFYYNKDDIKNAPVIKSIIGTIITNYEKERGGFVSIFKIKEQRVQIGKIKGDSLGYLIPGVISMSILSLGMFSIIEVFARYKKLGILKRLSVTPMRPFSFMIGVVLGRLLIGVGNSFLIYFISILVFKIDFSLNILLFLITILVSGISMSGLGALIVLLSKNSNTASNVGGILFTIMLFFSGVYFPLSFIPEKIRLLSYIFPLTYVAQNARYAMGVEYVDYRFFIWSNLIMLLGGLLLLQLIGKRYLEKIE